MSTIPSYARKLYWADRHIARLDELVTEFAARHPYEVRQTMKAGREVNRFHFTERPHPDLQLIAGDVLANLRSGLDHLVTALVPRGKRREVLFPILHEPLWDLPFEEGENRAERTIPRARWDGVVKRLIHPEAEQILRSLQPLTAYAQPPKMHPLDVLNWLSNADRHRQLTVVMTGLDDITANLVLRGGFGLVEAEPVQADTDDPALLPYTALGDGAVLPLDPSAKYIKLRGQVVVALKINGRRELIRVPRELRAISDWLKVYALEPLSKYAVGDED